MWSLRRDLGRKGSASAWWAESTRPAAAWASLSKPSSRMVRPPSGRILEKVEDQPPALHPSSDEDETPTTTTKGVPPLTRGRQRSRTPQLLGTVINCPINQSFGVNPKNLPPLPCSICVAHLPLLSPLTLHIVYFIVFSF